MKVRLYSTVSGNEGWYMSWHVEYLNTGVALWRFVYLFHLSYKLTRAGCQPWGTQTLWVRVEGPIVTVPPCLTSVPGLPRSSLGQTPALFLCPDADSFRLWTSSAPLASCVVASGEHRSQAIQSPLAFPAVSLSKEAGTSQTLSVLDQREK